jgi:hypothetical protein
VDTRIEQEIAGLRTAMQASKVSAITMWDNPMASLRFGRQLPCNT